MIQFAYLLSEAGLNSDDQPQLQASSIVLLLRATTVNVPSLLVLDCVALAHCLVYPYHWPCQHLVDGGA